MTWIRIIDEAKASGELAELYQQESAARGQGNLLQVHSLNPRSLRAHLELFRTLMYGQSELTRRQREMIGLVVSVLNRCPY